MLTWFEPWLSYKMMIKSSKSANKAIRISINLIHTTTESNPKICVREHRKGSRFSGSPERALQHELSTFSKEKQRERESHSSTYCTRRRSRSSIGQWPRTSIRLLSLFLSTRVLGTRAWREVAFLPSLLCPFGLSFFFLSVFPSSTMDDLCVYMDMWIVKAPWFPSSLWNETNTALITISTMSLWVLVRGTCYALSRTNEKRTSNPNENHLYGQDMSRQSMI